MDFPADITYLPALMAYVRSQLVAKNISLQEINRVELAVEEALVNVISYAYPQRKGVEQVSVDCALTDERRFEVVIKDSGVPFNPLEAEIDPRVDRPIEERNIGGLGVFLVRKLVDEMTYSRLQEQNILKFQFTLKK